MLEIQVNLKNWEATEVSLNGVDKYLFIVYGKGQQPSLREKLEAILVTGKRAAFI
ncbi:hypothetical protein T07_11688 [Trichinella nelsoni]|uniref:Uncharacterized protein n=1 Tax=Trichinella nelsoni TaxID=6336 RepID=A0A0V0RVQ6_9BILA|nr:hypothetical protein T07_11688 [Trichinella nelsoni]